MGCSPDEAVARAREIRRTWAFLFQSKSIWRKGSVRRVYNSLVSPPWVRNYVGNVREHANLGGLATQGLSAACFDVSQHLRKGWLDFTIFKAETLKYTDFPEYKTRIMALRKHVNERKRKGFFKMFLLKDEPEFNFLVLALFSFFSVALLFLLVMVISQILQAYAAMKGSHP
jgi:hypothetical protein